MPSPKLAQTWLKAQIGLRAARSYRIVRDLTPSAEFHRTVARFSVSHAVMRVALPCLLLLSSLTAGCGNAGDQPEREQHVLPTPQPVAEILRIEDDTQFAIAMSDLVFARESAAGYEQLTPAERVVFCLDGLEREVNNGGFAQFFENSAGDHALETIDALRTLGAPRVAALVSEAVSVFPDGQPATDRERRQRQLDGLDEHARAALDRLDEAFYQYPENLTALERAFVRAQQDQFRMP